MKGVQSSSLPLLPGIFGQCFYFSWHGIALQQIKCVQTAVVIQDVEHTRPARGPLGTPHPRSAPEASRPGHQGCVYRNREKKERLEN